MANPLTSAGATAEATEYAPLTMDRYITGLVTQRSPLRDADVPYIQEKYYSAGRFDSMIDGLNLEISARATLVRRPGHFIYNSQSFPAIARFYEFRLQIDGVSSVRVLCDTAGAVYDCTGPATKILIYNKVPGFSTLSPGRTSFQSVGNTLYFSDRLTNHKWTISAIAWKPGTVFAPGAFLTDTNNNLQVATAPSTSLPASIASTSVSTHTLSPGGRVTTASITLAAPANYVAGQVVSFSGVSAASALNGLSGPIVFVSSPTQITFNFPSVQTDQAQTADSGTVTPQGTTSGITGATQPAWDPLAKATLDGGLLWQNKGSAVQPWGTAAPVNAPTLSQVFIKTNLPAWMAAIYYLQVPIQDPNGNLQLLTTPGTTGSAEPTWTTVAGGTTADGTAVWTCVGPEGYAPGTFLTNHYVAVLYPTGPGTTSASTFRIQTEGTTGATTPVWVDGFGALVPDGSAVWENVGPILTWAAIGAAVPVTNVDAILDPAGYQQDILKGGVSGATIPTFAIDLFGSTIDGAAIWSNAGPIAPGATAAQTFAYSFKNSVTDTVSTASPRSQPVTSGVDFATQLQGGTSLDAQNDTIVVWATVQGGSTLIYVDEFPQPLTGIWTYLYTLTDAELSANLERQAPIADINDPPPIGLGALSYHLNRVWGRVGNLLYWASGPDSPYGAGNEAWSPSNVFDLPETIARLVPVTLSNGAMLAFTASDVYAVFGTGTAANPFYVTLYAAGTGLLNYDALDIIGSTIHLFSAAGKQISFDPSAGYTETGFVIGDQFATVTTGLLNGLGGTVPVYDPATAFVTWHEQTSGDTGLFVADGAVGWFRYAPISAPESGFLWGPRAVIEGGTSAVQSVETSIGRKTLLVGPPIAGGKILMRDTRVNDDNLVTYRNTYGVIGSIQLCLPSEIAEVAAVMLDSLRKGTAPTVGILLGEIFPTAAVPFDLLERTGPDPPDLPASVTLFNDRFVALQNGQPVKCRHMQLLLQWVPESVANELLTHTIYGAKHSERRQQ